MGDFVAVILEKQVAEYEDYRKLKLFTEVGNYAISWCPVRLFNVFHVKIVTNRMSYVRLPQNAEISSTC